MVWLAGRSELGICQRLCFGSTFGPPNPLKTPSIPDLLGFLASFPPTSRLLAVSRTPCLQHLSGFRGGDDFLSG